VVPGAPSPGVKRAGLEAGHSPPPALEVKRTLFPYLQSYIYASKSVGLDDMPSFVIKGRVVAQVVSHRSFIAVSLFHALLSSCGIYGGRNGTGTGFSESTLSVPGSIIPPRISILIF
jgi:hypothetical protein